MSNIPASIHLPASATAPRRALARLWVIIPLLVFFGIAALLLVRLGAGNRQGHVLGFHAGDPHVRVHHTLAHVGLFELDELIRRQIESLVLAACAEQDQAVVDG